MLLLRAVKARLPSEVTQARKGENDVDSVMFSSLPETLSYFQIPLEDVIHTAPSAVTSMSDTGVPWSSPIRVKRSEWMS